MIKILLPVKSANSKMLVIGDADIGSGTEYGDPVYIAQILTPELLLEDGSFLLLESNESIFLG
jgi:hypothetical protein